MTKEQQNDFIIEFFITLGIDTKVENRVNHKKEELISLVYKILETIPEEHIAYKKIIDLDKIIEEYDTMVKHDYINFGRALEIMEREK